VRRGGGVYAYRTRKPGARLSIPVLSFHWGYVGRTTSFYHRDQQHIYGFSSFGPSNPKPWADLVVDCYRIRLPRWIWLHALVEQILIFALAPVYNVQGNTWNPRRIEPWKAQAQRRLRDAHVRVWHFTVGHLILCAAVGVALYLIIWR